MPSPAPSPERVAETVDPLTGLADRHRFARAIYQADRDRDRMVVAVVAVDGLAEVNRLCGHHAGDDLLRSLGRSLAARASVDVTVARIGGTTFGLLWAPADDHPGATAVGPVVDDVERTIERWAEQLAGLGTPSPVRPMPIVGLAEGFDGEAWAEAELALEVAMADRGATVVGYDREDQRVAERRRHRRILDELGRTIDGDRLGFAAAPIDTIDTIDTIDGELGTGGAGSDGTRRPGRAGRPAPRWLRLGLHLPTAGRATDELTADGVTAAELGAAPGLAAAIDRRLLRRATSLLATGAKVTVALHGDVVGRRSSIGTGGGWPPGLLVEVAQDRLAALDEPSCQELARRLHALGWGLVIARFDGGLEAWRTAERLDARWLVLSDDLVRHRAEPERGIGRLLTTSAAIASTSGRRLLANEGAFDGERPDGRGLRAMGFDGVVGAAAPLPDRQVDGPNSDS